ncbi:glycosyltransferase [Rivularia sp. UHCC 0363]|uniref:glycosyltransferase n=1 Tax=Rivularia sp. UHCC 0363 TaxID=3110244 RepID=UPI002B210042|nr:glycosyltransferase [Rivularia sp. UHCC 0363]MEA5598891.1 glycosyltransferase [Rivularia sp. UHCC 0363]
MSKILFISAHAPTNLYPQAGQKIALSNLDKYYSDNTTVDVVAIANKAEIDAATDLVDKYSNLFTYPLTKSHKIISCLTRISIPFKFSSRYQATVAEKIQELLQKNTYDVIHFEYSHAAIYLDLIKPLINNYTRTVISIHDIVAQSFLRKSETNFILGIEVARLFQLEKKLYQNVNQLWVLSKKDRDILTSLFSIPEDKIIIKPPQLSSFISQVKRHPDKIEQKSLLFWGAMNRPENEQAVINFLQNCFAKLLKINPECKLYIVGSNPSAKIINLKNNNIIVTGFVEDPTPFFEKAEIGIVPLLQGAGIKLKTLEMLAAGLPVISTNIGAEGIESSENLLVNDRLNEWVNIITGLGKKN